MRVGPKAKPGESSPPRRGSPLAPAPCASRADGSQPSPGLDQRIGWVQTSVESVGAKLGSMEAEVSKMAVAHEGLERRVVGALEQILHRVNEMERKMPRGRVGM